MYGSVGLNMMDYFMFFMIGFGVVAILGTLWGSKWGDRN